MVLKTTFTYETPHELEVRGFDVLVKHLGPGGAIQFIGRYERGVGDYVQERKRILKGVTLEVLRGRLIPKGNRRRFRPAV
jgi:hypothetical protein